MDKPVISDNIIYLLIGDNNEQYSYNYTWICYASKSKEKIEQAKLENEKWAEGIEKKYYPEGYENAENKYHDVLFKVDMKKVYDDNSTAPYDSKTKPSGILRYRSTTWSIEEVKELI